MTSILPQGNALQMRCQPNLRQSPRLVGASDWLHTFPGPNIGVQQLLATFERSFEVAHAEPQSQVLGFTLNRLSTVRRWTDDSWSLAQNLMAQAVLVDPGSLHQFVRAIVRIWIEHGRTMDRDLLESVITSTVLEHAPREHGSEVAWAIWAAMSFAVPMSAEVATAVAAVEDDVVAMVCLEANRRKLFVGGLDVTRWSQWMTPEQLYGEHWLVAYEAYERRMLPSLGGSDYVAADNPGFGWLRDEGVRFTKPFRRPSRGSLGRFPTPGRGY